MQVERVKLVSIFKALGFPAAQRWGAKRMHTKLKTLPVFLDENEDMMENLDDQQTKTLEDMVEAIDNEEEIEIVLPKKKEADKPAKKKAPKKATKAPEPKADEDEEEEEDDEEEDEESDVEDEEEEDEEEDEEEEEEEEAPAKKPAKKSKSKKGKKEKKSDEIKAGDGVCVANPEEGDESWSGTVVEMMENYAIVKEPAGDEWEEPLSCLTKLAQPPKAVKSKKEKKKSKSDKPKKPGVIATIKEILENATQKKPASKADILEALIEKFPERASDSMKGTIGVQVPSKLTKEKGMEILKNDKGYYTA